MSFSGNDYFGRSSAARFWPSPWLMCLPWRVGTEPCERPASSLARSARAVRETGAQRA